MLFLQGMTQDQLAKQIEVIPPFASSLMRLSDLIMSGEYTLDDVVKVVKLDQGLTVDVIAYANSAESGPSAEITSVQHAIVRMGGARLLRYLLAKWFRGSVYSTLGSDSNSSSLWLHGVQSSILSDQLAFYLPTFKHPMAFTTCLLHDIGRIPLAVWATENHVVYDWSKNDLATIEMEKNIFGFDHGHVGAMVLERWKFAPAIVDAVRSHGEQYAPYNLLNDSIRIANLVCKELSHPSKQFPEATVLAHHGITDEMWWKLVESTDAQSKVVLSEFGIG